VGKGVSTAPPKPHKIVREMGKQQNRRKEHTGGLGSLPVDLVDTVELVVSTEGTDVGNAVLVEGLAEGFRAVVDLRETGVSFDEEGVRGSDVRCGRTVAEAGGGRREEVKGRS
jgi:hypothetical protein